MNSSRDSENSQEQPVVMIGKQLGRYQIIEKIGAGGMGEVYRARDERLERDVALKFLPTQTVSDDSSRKRFRKEALVLSKLNHPNVATILDYEVQEGIDFLVMEHIRGTTLAQTLAHKALSEKEMVPIAIQIAAALEEAHHLGIIHRDLKPGNVMITPKGQVKVLDFGLAKFTQPLDSQHLTHASTETNLIVGTMPYMSPEQLKGEALDGRTDIYSFGVVLYEMCTGRKPHQETQPITLADAILHKAPAMPLELQPDLSPRMQEVILKCLEKDPENRYQTVQDLLIDLRRLSTPSMVTSPLESKKVSRLAGKQHRKLLMGVVAALFLIAAAAVIGMMLLRKPVNVPLQYASNIRSIVALPSKIYGPEENRFLTDAIPNALSTHLSQLDGIETKVPPTEVEMQRVDGDLARLAEVYGVNALVSSTATLEPGRFMLTVQLIEASSRRLLWSREYDGQRDNYLDLVRSAAEGLRAALQPDGKPIEADRASTQNPDAELVFQRAFYHLRAYANRKEPKDFDNALSDFKQALQLDPNMAVAAAAIARLHVAKLESGSPLREVLPLIDEWSYRALQLDHRCGEAWQILSVAEEMRPSRDKRKRLEYALKAATYAGRSGYSHHVLSTAIASNSFVLCVEAAQESIRREPLHLNGLLFIAGILSRQGKTEEGLELVDRVLSVESNMPVAILMKQLLLLRNQRSKQAEQYMPMLQNMVTDRRLHPGWVDLARDWLDFEKALAENDSKQAIDASLSRLVSLARGEAPPFPRWELVTGNMILLQARHDSPESTLETLARRAEKGVFEPYDWLLLTPELEPVRRDRQFQTVVAKSRSEFEEMLAILESARQRNELPAYLEKLLPGVRRLLANPL